MLTAPPSAKPSAWAEISIAFIFENFSYFIMHFFFLQYFQNFLKIEIVHSKYVLKTHFFVFHLRCLLYNFLHPPYPQPLTPICSAPPGLCPGGRLCLGGGFGQSPPPLAFFCRGLGKALRVAEPRQKKAKQPTATRRQKEGCLHCFASLSRLCQSVDATPLSAPPRCTASAEGIAFRFARAEASPRPIFCLGCFAPAKPSALRNPGKKKAVQPKSLNIVSEHSKDLGGVHQK
jgi:hypothetical protein